MKKTLIVSICIVCLGFVHVLAQKSEGGIPLSMNPNINSEVSSQKYVQVVSLNPPDIDVLKNEDKNSPKPGLFRIGALVKADIDMINSGTLLSLSDGSKIWRLKIQIPGVQSLGIYYDKFHLPDGVKYYLFNANAKQILGAYTSAENPDDGIWTNEKVQGELINLEMDIDPNVDISAIQMHINNVGVFYRATEYLTVFDDATQGSNYRLTTGPGFAYGGSSACEINAVCSTSVGAYTNQSNATVHIEYIVGKFIYGGTGVMMNNTSQSCRPYILTASHVEPTNSTSNTTFSGWGFYFNYQAPSCVYSGGQPSYNTMVGAYFRARSSYDSNVAGIKDDFLLLELKYNPPNSYNYYFSGWDNTNYTFSLSGTFIGYHHPSGDIKKVSTGTSVSPNGSFNITSGGAANSHWAIVFAQGGIEEGSSGSGLFNTSGNLIGILSGGNTASSCTSTNVNGQRMNISAEYSKIAKYWSANAFESPSTSTNTLKSWLDPTGSGVAIFGGMTGCPDAVSSVKNTQNKITVYPSPANKEVYINGEASTNVDIQLYNVVGVLMVNQSVKTDGTGKYILNLSPYNAGVYIIRIEENNKIYTNKITISK